MEANNGADYVVLDNYRFKDQTVHLEIGHCCVVMVDRRVPVELMTSVFSELVIQEGSIEAVAARYLRYNDKEWSQRRREHVMHRGSVELTDEAIALMIIMYEEPILVEKYFSDSPELWELNFTPLLKAGLAYLSMRPPGEADIKWEVGLNSAGREEVEKLHLVKKIDILLAHLDGDLSRFVMGQTALEFIKVLNAEDLPAFLTHRHFDVRNAAKEALNASVQ